MLELSDHLCKNNLKNIHSAKALRSISHLIVQEVSFPRPLEIAWLSFLKRETEWGKGAGGGGRGESPGTNDLFVLGDTFLIISGN